MRRNKKHYRATEKGAGMTRAGVAEWENCYKILRTNLDETHGIVCQDR